MIRNTSKPGAMIRLASLIGIAVLGLAIITLAGCGDGAGGGGGGGGDDGGGGGGGAVNFTVQASGAINNGAEGQFPAGISLSIAIENADENADTGGAVLDFSEVENELKTLTEEDLAVIKEW
ncbi:MAG: hypothetical protein LBS57_06660, partial [Treponema sp.]|nr:hypothetical protein [Treponema sp.]